MAVAGAIVPHAPVLLQSVGGVDSNHLAPLRDAVTNVAGNGDALVVLLSPHGAATGVYREAAGSLDSFGIRGEEMAAPVDVNAARELAQRWGQRLIDAEVDFGVVVPLLLGVTGRSEVVAAAIEERLSADEAGEAGRAFAEALSEIAGDRPVVFVASAHTSSALSPRAPLGRRREAVAAADEFVTALGGEGDLRPALSALAADRASCSMGPLCAWTQLFVDARREVLRYESPFGVGYLVARAER